MVESQSYGFIIQRHILEYLYGYKEYDESPGYTAKYDLMSQYNDVDVDACNISIKTTGNKKRVDMGDALRVFDSVSDSSEPLNMIVVNYIQKDKLKEVTTIVQANLSQKVQLLFGEIKKNDIEELIALVKKKNPSKDDIAKRKSLNLDLNKKSTHIQFNAKIGSNQKRLQCSFFDFPKFLIENPTLIVHKGDSTNFRGLKIPEIISERRQFKKKII